MFKIKLCGILIAIDNKYGYIEEKCADFITDDEGTDVSISVGSADIEYERERSEGEFSDGYLEYIAAYRAIAEQLYRYDAMVMHGAVISYKGRGYLFTAKSGVGKSTHIRLWHKAFPEDVTVIDGDKPIIRLIDGRPYAFGTAWRGKEMWGGNRSVPLCGIVFLGRGAQNTAAPSDLTDASVKLFKQTHIPRGREAALKTAAMAESLIRKVKLVDLLCNMEEEAASVCRDALTKE